MSLMGELKRAGGPAIFTQEVRAHLAIQAGGEAEARMAPAKLQAIPAGGERIAPVAAGAAP